LARPPAVASPAINTRSQPQRIQVLCKMSGLIQVVISCGSGTTSAS